MNIFSRRKRLLNRTPARANAGPAMSTDSPTLAGHAVSRTKRVRRAVRRNRALVVALIAVAGLVALLGGISGAFPGKWDPEALPPPLSARFGQATVWDENNHEMVVFGGFGPESANSTTIVALGDTWSTIPSGEWNNRNPILAPLPRGYAAMAYDAARKQAVLFGGATYRPNTKVGRGAVYNDTWTWDGKDWTLQNPSGPVPPARRNASMAYDAHRKVVVLFGGRNAEVTNSTKDGALMNDTWTWDGVAWKQMPAPVSPGRRYGAAMAYDLCRAQSVLFGGTAGADGYSHVTLLGILFGLSGDTWVWDGKAWTQKALIPNPATGQTIDPASPPARYGASMAYSHKSGQVLLYGGLSLLRSHYSPVAADADLWRWNGSAWEKEISETNPQNNVTGIGGKITTYTLPPPRAYTSFAFSPQRKNFLVFGGTPGGEVDFATVGGELTAAVENPTPQVALKDVWLYDENRFNLREGLTKPRGCDDPVPLPVDEAPPPLEKVELETRKEIKEFTRLPVLLGDDPRTVPAGAPKPPCLRRQNAEEAQNTHLFTDPARNRVYQMFICNGELQGDGSTLILRLLFEAYHGDTLKPLGRALAPVSWADRAVVIHDLTGGRILVLTSTNSGQGFVNHLYVIDQNLIEQGQNPLVRKITLPAEIPPFPPWVTTFGHPTSGRTKLLFGTHASSTVGLAANPDKPPSLLQLDLDDNRVDWRREVTGCLNIGQGFRSGNRVYTSCLLGGQQAVVRTTIVEVAGDPVINDREEAGDSLEVFTGGPRGFVGVIGADPQSERLLFSINGTGPSDGATDIWTFDGKAGRWVGRVAVTRPSTSGLDPSTGRLYLQAPDTKGQTNNTLRQGGLYVVDSGLTPVAQALNFSQYAYLATGSIVTLPPKGALPRRVFLRRAGGRTPAVYEDDPEYQAQAEATANYGVRYPDGQPVRPKDEMTYLVLADELSVPKPPEISEQDRLTFPVAEDPAKTEPIFDAEGSGYGMRLRSIGGIESVTRPFPQIGDTASFYDASLRSSGLSPACIYPDRELMMGWVSKARFSDFVTVAQSSGLETDSSTKTDLSGPSTRCYPKVATPESPNLSDSVREVMWDLWPLLPFAEIDNNLGSGTVEMGKDADGTTSSTTTPLGILEQGQDQDGKPTAKYYAPTGTAWDKHFYKVECVGDTQNNHQTAGGSVFGSVACSRQTGLVTGAAHGRSAGVGEESDPQGFSIGEGSSQVSVRRDPQKGMVVTVVSIAKGIKLGPLSIDRVETRAEAWSNGRPFDDARASFSRKICGVITSDYQNGRCLSSGEQRQFVDEWNKRWGINSKMFLPTPDPAYLQGSPGGYTSGVVMGLADEVEARLFGGDSLKELPGLVIEFYKDSAAGPGRQVLQLASVRAIANYGVQCNPDRIYSPQAKDCVLLSFDDDLLEEEFFEEDEEFFEEDESELDGEWTEVEAIVDSGESLGSKIGKLLEQLPILSGVPVREIAEALLLGSVWVLLGLPLLLAYRRLSLYPTRRS